MKQVPECYYDFWSKMFQLTPDQLKTSEPMTTTAGRYIEKHKDEYIFFYSDLINGKKILAASVQNMKTMNPQLDITKLLKSNADEIRLTPPFAAMKLEFCDIDFCLLEPNDFVSVPTNSFDIRTLSSKNEMELQDFYKELSEDDQDTLSLDLKQDYALGIYDGEHLVGVTRYLVIRDTQLTDITVVVSSKVRGKGYATALVSALIQVILSKKLQLKYRVKEDNHSSIAIAKRLGLTPVFRLLAFSKL